LRGYKIGSIAGITIEINISWLFILFLILLWFAGEHFPAKFPHAPIWQHWLAGFIAAVLFFTCVMVHEVAHSLVARRYDVEVSRITLFIFGGVAQTKGEPKTALSELYIAVAGPLASLALAGILYGSSWGITQFTGAVIIAEILNLNSFLNLILAVFNMVPAFPLDGGRVLRACLWHLWDDLLRATRWATTLGKGFGFILMSLGVWVLFTRDFISGLWYLGLGWLVAGAATAALQQVTIQMQLQRLAVGQLMTAPVLAVDTAMPIQQAVEQYFWPYQQTALPVVQAGRPVGVLKMDTIYEVDRSQWPNLYAEQLMTQVKADEDTIEATTGANDALNLLLRNENNYLLVTDRGKLVGVISENGLAAAIR